MSSAIAKIIVKLFDCIREIENVENAMEAIQKQLDLVEWNADTLDNIADIMRSAGYEIRDKTDKMLEA